MTDSCDDPCDDITRSPQEWLGWIKRIKKDLTEIKKTVDTLPTLVYKYDIR